MKSLLVLSSAVAALVGSGGCNWASTDPKRIGVYDSRGIAVAYAGTEHHERETARLAEMLKQAKAAGDEKRAKEIDARIWSRRKRLHRQGFGGAPVDDILETIKDSLPEIRRQANVSALISKWDKKALRRYRSAERVDVTDLMVQPFNPNEKKLKTIEAMKGRPPVPLWRLNLMMAAGGC